MNTLMYDKFPFSSTVKSSPILAKLCKFLLYLSLSLLSAVYPFGHIRHYVCSLSPLSPLSPLSLFHLSSRVLFSIHKFNNSDGTKQPNSWPCLGSSGPTVLPCCGEMSGAAWDGRDRRGWGREREDEKRVARTQTGRQRRQGQRMIEKRVRRNRRKERIWDKTQDRRA